MSLWGNNDNKLSDGTVSVNHANRTVIGSGTTFGGGVGYAATGDIIRFGAPFGGVTGYFGEAVIIGIAGTQSIVINSTAGLSPQEIDSQQYQITQSPKSTVIDAAFNKFSKAVSQRGDLKLDTTINANVALAATTIVVNSDAATAGIGTTDVVEIQHGFKNVRLQFAEVFNAPTAFSAGVSTVTIKSALKSIHSAYKTDGAAYGAGDSLVNLQFAPARSIADGDASGAHLTDLGLGDTFTIGTNSIGIGTISHVVVDNVDTAIVTLNTPLTQPIAANPLGSTVIIKRGALAGSTIKFRGKESISGDETQVVGVATAGVRNAVQTAFETGAGWVGVQTYRDHEGNLRVKKEILVAMSGIQTGNTPIYDGNPFA
tara:strand:+ start:307 stop:1422 length:1116 start_codon:yes stop_codon:yes gene_type:complete